MKVLKSKTPYLILLAIFFCLAATDSLFWSQQVEPVVVEVEQAEETKAPTSESFIKLALTDSDE